MREEYNMDDFTVNNPNLRIRTNVASRINNRAEEPDKFQKYANVCAGRSLDGKETLLNIDPSNKELREARSVKKENQETRRKSTRGYKPQD